MRFVVALLTFLALAGPVKATQAQTQSLTCSERLSCGECTDYECGWDAAEGTCKNYDYRHDVDHAFLIITPNACKCLAYNRSCDLCGGASLGGFDFCGFCFNDDGSTTCTEDYPANERRCKSGLIGFATAEPSQCPARAEGGVVKTGLRSA